MSAGPLKATVTTYLRLTIEVPSGSSWGAECTLDQIFEQTRRETTRKIEAIFHEHGQKMKVIGQPEVVAHTTEIKR